MKTVEEAAQAVLWHVEDANAVRVNGQCTLCFTYRQMLRDALRESGLRCCSPSDLNVCETCQIAYTTECVEMR